MRLRVKVQKTLPRNIGDGDNERVVVQPGMNSVGRRQGDCVGAARRRRAEEKRR